MRSLFLMVVAAAAGNMAWAQDRFEERYADSKFQPLLYRNPGLVVDLGVGLWAHPLPCDFDGDGDLDLVVSTVDKPSNGIYFFENTEGNVLFPVFKPGVWLCPGAKNITISYVEGAPRILREGFERPGFLSGDYESEIDLGYTPDFFYEGRAKQWKRCDYDGDGVLDVLVGASDWRDYGWDNAFNAQGEWTHGRLHGRVHFVRNTGTNDAPEWAKAEALKSGGEELDVYGCPSPNLADWDGDGDLDLVCGEFLDRMTYFENVGTRTSPVYGRGRFLTYRGEDIRMDLEMLQVVACDWDGDGDMDLVVGQEDGRVALLECTGLLPDRTPAFSLPRFFQQEAYRVKTGALCTPVSVDWDGDGDEDLLVGDTAGYINFVENLDGACPPKWAAPVYLKADGKTLRIQAGPNGSIQGPAEAKWGYTVLDAADWDQDGYTDIVINSIWGKVEWYRNPSRAGAKDLEPARPIEVAWEGATPKPAWFWWMPEGKALVTQWRTSPVVRDWDGDGLNDLIMLDTEGYLAFFQRQQGENGLALLPPRRIFLDETGNPLRLNEREAGGSGRRKLAFTDWDGDGRIDILINSKNIDFLRNVGTDERSYMFKNEGMVDPHPLAGHTTCPTPVDWDKNGVPDLLVGAEDGFFYYLENPHSR